MKEKSDSIASEYAKLAEKRVIPRNDKTTLEIVQEATNKNFKETIKNLNPVSKQLFDNLNYILDNEGLALGYLGIFENIVEREKINAKIDALQESMRTGGKHFGLIGKYKVELSKFK